MKKIFALFLFAAGALGAWLWFKSSPAAGPEGEIVPAARVEVQVLRTQVISQTLETFGVVAAAPSGEQVITAPFDCLVRRVATVTGARVAAGDTLLEISPSPDAKLQFDTARSAHELARQALTAAQERYDLKLANRQELLTAQQAELEAQQKLTSLESRGLGRDGRIISPTTGVVGKLEHSPGILVPSGSVLVTVTADAGLEARLGVEAADAAQVAAGQAVTLVSTNRPGAAPFTSAVRAMTGTLDLFTGAAEARVPVPIGAALLLGEHVKATIELKKKEALVAPRNAVLPEAGKLVLYTVMNGKAVRHEVTTGIIAGDLIEVSSPDLHAGDSAVTLGNYELNDGMAVQSKTAQANEQPLPPESQRKESKP